MEMMEDKGMFWKSAIVSWVIAIILGFVIYGWALASYYPPLVASGLFRAATDMSAVIIFNILVLVGILVFGKVYVKSMTPEMMGMGKKLGIMFGIIWALPNIGNYFFINIPSIFPVADTVFGLLVFGLTGWVFDKMYMKGMMMEKPARRRR